MPLLTVPPAKHFIHDVIDPKETRAYIIRALEISYNATPQRHWRTQAGQLADKILELALRVRLMPECRVAPRKRDLTFLFMEIKGFVKPAQNTHIRSCMLRF